MTAPDMVSIIAAALAEHRTVHEVLYADYYSCSCGHRGKEQPSDHQARAVLTAISEAHMLRPEPWPPIPYPVNAKHQARCTIQRAHDAAWFRTGDHNEGHMAAAEALIAEGWTPPQTAVEG